MANVFQPTLESNVRYDQPVDKPSIFGAVAAVAGNLGEALVRSKTSGSGGSTLSYTERKDIQDRQDLAFFGEEMSKLEAYRQEHGEAAAQIKERQIAANFAAKGITFNSDYQQVYETATGRPWAGYGYQDQAHVAQKMKDSPEFQNGYLASYAELGPEATDTDRFTYASQYAAEVSANEVIIKKNTIDGVVQWNNATQGVYESERERIKGASIGLMMQAVANGQVITEEDFSRTRAIWEQYKSERPRPQNIPDDLWKAEADARANVDAAFTNLQTAVGNKAIADRLMSGMAKMAQDGGDPITALAILKAPDVVIANHQGNVQSTLATISKGYNATVNTSSLFDSINTDTGVVEPAKLPENLQAIANEGDPKKVWEGAEAAHVLTTGTPNDLQRPEFKQQFVDQATVLGASMMNTKNTAPLSAEFIQKSVASPTFVNNIKTLESLDPIAGASVKATVLSGINTEVIKQQQKVDSIEATTFSKWTGTGYEFDPVKYKNTNPNATEGQIASAKIVWDKAHTGYSKTDIALAEQYRQGIDLLEKTRNQLTDNTGPTKAEVNNSSNVFNVPTEILQDRPFIEAVNNVSSNLGFNPDWLMRAIDFETAGSWSTSITAPGTGATGLIQFIPSTARSLGISTAELATMDRATQMQYVQKYLAPYKGRINNFGDLYMAIHYPVAVGKGDSFVLYSKGTKAYDFNKSLDGNGDGTVTRGEAVNAALRRSGGGKVTQMNAGRPLFLDPATGTPFGSTPATSQAPDVTIETGSPTAALEGGPQAGPESTATILPEVTNAPSAPRTAPVEPLVPSDVVKLVKGLTRKATSTDELAQEIIKYLEGRDAATN